MTAKIIDGRALAEEWKEKLRAYVAEENLKPSIAVILVGDNPASQIYVRNKMSSCEKTGINCVLHKYSVDVSEDKIMNLIAELNNDANINGILVQMPLPSHINTTKIIETIHPEKDIDGFHPYNVGRLYSGNPSFVSCTPMGIIHLVKSVTDIVGKNAVVIGRSLIVGKPVAAMLLNENATVTVTHSKTKNLSSITSKADILISATGRPRSITREYVKENAVVIDVGITRGDDGKLCGDVDFESVKEIAGAITPVPGGVGPMTIAMLMYNAVKSYSNQNDKKMQI